MCYHPPFLLWSWRTENALGRIAQIIKLKYQDIETENISGLTRLFDTYHPGVRKIREFFRRAGCDQDYVIYDGQQDTYLALARIQMQPSGRVKLIRIIEQLSDPEEYFDDPESREVVIKQINDVLSRYYLRVSKDGKVLTSPILIALDTTVSMLNEYRENVSPFIVDKSKYPACEQQKVFICYSHKDVKWLEQLHVHLKLLERRGIIDLWDDTNIPWREEIENAIEAATVAVTLVSADFLASDFISKYEILSIIPGQ